MDKYVIKIGNRYLKDPGTLKPVVTLNIAEAAQYPRSEAHVKANALKNRGIRTCVIEAPKENHA